MNQVVNIPPMQKVHGIELNADLSQGPFFIDGCDTLPKLFEKRCGELGARTAHREKDFGIWRSYSWTDWYEQARLLGLGLISLGFGRGDVAAILSEDNKEWLYADLGIQCAGGIVTGVYTTDAASQLAYIVNDSGAKFLFLENDEQLDKYLEVRDRMPGLVKVIVFDPEGLHDFRDPNVIFIEDLYEMGRQELARQPGRFEQEIAASRPDDIAILIYTSGTTGMPKGVMIDHSNMMYTIAANVLLLPVFPEDEQVCFLPLCHILERMISVSGPIAARSTVNFAESTETVFENVREVSPTAFTAVPRVWEKIYSQVVIMATDATPLGRWHSIRQ